jgi:hypothetical protein
MENKCRIYLEHYKRQIWDNVNSFLKRLNGNWDALTDEDLNDDEQTKDDDAGEDEIVEAVSDRAPNEPSFGQARARLEVK